MIWRPLSQATASNRHNVFTFAEGRAGEAWGPCDGMFLSFEIKDFLHLSTFFWVRRAVVRTQFSEDTFRVGEGVCVFHVRLHP
jgi:hypothetical protein